MTLPSEDRNALIGLLRELTSGELSTIVASLEEPQSQIGTSLHGANYRLLARMVELKLAEEVPLGVALPSTVTSFRIYDDAKPEIANLISTATDP